MNVAFIPVRGGSKSIPLKNIRPICGKPLVYWTMKAACGCRAIDRVYIATDSDEIRAIAEGFITGTEKELFAKAEVISRSAESASDTASTESAMLEFAEKHDFDNIVLIQATSPLLQAKDLDKGFEAFNSDGTDSVLSVVRQKRFNWKTGENGFAIPTNYKTEDRPRRQDFEGYLVENGAFYITGKSLLQKTGIRISGNIKAVEMPEDSFFEIDEPDDWMIIEALMKKNGLAESGPEIPEIKMFLTDCDGCLTDGGMYYSENGDELKKFNTRDGVGFRLLREHGILTGILTGEKVKLNERRAEKLKIDILEPACTDKLGTARKLCEKFGISLENVCYVGDDLIDVDLIRAAGFGTAPSDAAPKAKEAADYITETPGGRGVIREVAEFILEKSK
jgi:N-acylneuraminate cytidylyltransferase